MADIIKKIDYFAMEVTDKPGEGSKILNLLGQAGVNLLAFSKKAGVKFLNLNGVHLLNCRARARS